jgi:hypothetical protein
VTEQELTALAKHYGRMEGRRDERFIDTEALAEGYLALLAERDTLKAQVDEYRKQLAGQRRVTEPSQGEWVMPNPRQPL